MQLQGKRVLITGSSRGIGEALANKFADVGANLALVARNKDSLEAVADRYGGTSTRRRSSNDDRSQLPRSCRAVPTGDSADAAARRRPHRQRLVNGGNRGFPGLAAYSASKAALSHFTAGLRADLRGLPIGTTLVELGPVPTEMLAGTEDYEPTDKSFERFYRLRIFVDVPREKVAADVVNAVKKGRRHVRLPKRGAFNAMLTEAPRRATELILTGLPHR